MSEISSFQNQFDQNREYIETSYGEIDVIDLIPPQAKEIPVIFAPGWRETPELQQGCLEEVYNTQRRVIAFVHAASTIAIEKDYGDVPAVELQKARTILAILEAKHIKKTDIIAHSEGAINVAIAASLQPEKFRNIVLVTPAGLHGKDSIPRMLFGFARHMSKSGLNTNLVIKALKSKKRRNTSLKQNIHFALQEGIALTSYDIHPLLINLRKKGIKIAVLCGEKDTVLPFKKVKQHLSKLASEPNYGFDIFTTKPGGHELYLEPKEVMPQVLGLLEQLDLK